MAKRDSSAALSQFLTPKAWNFLSQRLKLSPRELQILRAVFAHDKESAIARAIGISPHTVRSHIVRLNAKLGVSDRTGLITAVFSEFLSLTADCDSPLPSICRNRTAGRCPLNQ
jgi:DNA-binding CsgD family transcriptional regulator